MRGYGIKKLSGLYEELEKLLNDQRDWEYKIRCSYIKVAELKARIENLENSLRR